LVKSKKSQFKERIKSFFKRDPCNKSISYKASDFKISVSVDVPGIADFDLKELSRQVKEVTAATTHVKYLDYYQHFLWCEIINSSDDPDYVRILRRFRVIIVSYIIRLGEILEQIKMDKDNTELKQELAKFSERMSELIYKLEKAVL
jgi:hypothetical protein